MTTCPKRAVGTLCAPTEQRDPRREPTKAFRYVDIASIDRKTKRIVKPPVLAGADAPSRARKVIHGGDVLVSTVRPNLNAVAIVPQELDDEIASTGFSVLRANPDVLEPRYLFYRTMSPDFVAALTSKVRGASYPAVSDRDVKRLKISVPSLSDQRRTVALLDEANHLRRLRAEADTKIARILPAFFLNMFGDPATNPMGWPERKIREVCQVIGGATPKTNRPEYWGGDVSWATPRDLSGLRDWILTGTQRTLTADGLASCSATMMPKGTVLLSSRAPIGLVAVSAIPICTNQGFKSLICGPDMDPWYLFGWCKLRAAYLQSLGHGATFKELSKRRVEAIRIPVPPLKKQRAFRGLVDRLASVRAPARLADARLAVLFRGLLHKAFTGSLTSRSRVAAPALPSATDIEVGL